MILIRSQYRLQTCRQTDGPTDGAGFVAGSRLALQVIIINTIISPHMFTAGHRPLPIRVTESSVWLFTIHFLEKQSPAYNLQVFAEATVTTADVTECLHSSNERVSSIKLFSNQVRAHRNEWTAAGGFIYPEDFQTHFKCLFNEETTFLHAFYFSSYHSSILAVLFLITVVVLHFLQTFSYVL